MYQHPHRSTRARASCTSGHFFACSHDKQKRPMNLSCLAPTSLPRHACACRLGPAPATQASSALSARPPASLNRPRAPSDLCRLPGRSRCRPRAPGRLAPGSGPPPRHTHTSSSTQERGRAAPDSPAAPHRQRYGAGAASARARAPAAPCLMAALPRHTPLLTHTPRLHAASHTAALPTSRAPDMHTTHPYSYERPEGGRGPSAARPTESEPPLSSRGHRRRHSAPCQKLVPRLEVRLRRESPRPSADCCTSAWSRCSTAYL